MLEQPRAQHSLNFPVGSSLLLLYFLWFTTIRGCNKDLYLFPETGFLEIGPWDGFTWEKEVAWRCIAGAGKIFRTQREASRTK